MTATAIPRRRERPRHLVLAFMAGLSRAAGLGARCYIDELEKLLRGGAGADA